MTQAHAVGDQPEVDERPARLGALMWALKAHEFWAELEEDGPLKVESPNRPGYVLTVLCAPRASDGGALWYVAGDQPISEAHNITEALTAIKGLTAVRM